MQIWISDYSDHAACAHGARGEGKVFYYPQNNLWKEGGCTGKVSRWKQQVVMAGE